MDIESDVINICTYYHSDSEEEIENILSSVSDIEYPKFLKNERIELNFKKLKDTKIIKSTGNPESTASEWGDKDTIEIDITDKESIDKEFSFHMHLTMSEHNSDMWTLYSKILDRVDNIKLSIISTADILDTKIDDLSVSTTAMGVHEDAKLDRIRFTMDGYTIGVTDYFGGSLIQVSKEFKDKEVEQQDLLNRVESFPGIDVDEVVV